MAFVASMLLLGLRSCCDSQLCGFPGTLDHSFCVIGGNYMIATRAI